MAILNELALLDLSAEAEHFTGLLLDQHAVPEKAGEDAAHIAVACVSGMDYLLTWNCKHISCLSTCGGDRKWLDAKSSHVHPVDRHHSPA